MNYNHMYRKKDRIRPRRTAEERQNLGRIGKAFAIAIAAGILAGGVMVLITGVVMR